MLAPGQLGSCSLQHAVAGHMPLGFVRSLQMSVGSGYFKHNTALAQASLDRNVYNSTTPVLYCRTQGSPQSAISIDEKAMTVTAAAGVTQRTLLKYLDNHHTDAAPDGYTLPAFSWFIDQTIAGAVATASHGSSFMYGSLSSQVRWLSA